MTQLTSLCGIHVDFVDILLLLLLLGTQVYVLNGTDPEGDPVRYGLMFEKGSKEYFRVDSKSGNVSLIQELDREVNLCWFFSKLPYVVFTAQVKCGLFLCRSKMKSQYL